MLKIAAGGADNSNSLYDPTVATTGQGIDETGNSGPSTYTNPNGGIAPIGSTGQNPPTGTSNGFMSNVNQFVSNGMNSSMLIPAVAAAINGYNNAGHYEDLGNQAAARADPFGNNGNRQQYIDQLSALYKDPSQIANTPGYKFALNQALDVTQSRLGAMGYGGTGTMADSLAAQASGLAQQTWNTEANRLAMLGGAQFDPSNAARMQMQGGQESIDAKNGALQALFSPFAGGAGTNITNNTGGGPGGGTNNNHLQDTLSRAVSSGAISAQSAQQLFNRLISSQGNISDGDLQTMRDLGIDPGVDLGGVDTAPGSYDSSGFGGYGNVNSSTGSIMDSQNGSPFSYGDYAGSGYNGDIVTDPSGDFAPTSMDDLFGPGG